MLSSISEFLAHFLRNILKVLTAFLAAHLVEGLYDGVLICETPLILKNSSISYKYKEGPLSVTIFFGIPQVEKYSLNTLIVDTVVILSKCLT